MASEQVGGLAVMASLLDLNHLNLEDQLGVGRNLRRRAAPAVGQLGGEPQVALAPDLHAGYALVPALDHFAGAKFEGERLAGVLAGVELRAVEQPAGVVNRDGVATGGGLAGALLQIVVFHAGGSLEHDQPFGASKPAANRLLLL